jgi:hypothetical protein
MSLRGAAESLATFLQAHPTVTLDSMIAGRYRAPTSYAAGAVFVQMVFDRGGIQAVKDLYGSPAAAGEMRSSMEQLFQQPWPRIAEAWRARALSFRNPAENTRLP